MEQYADVFDRASEVEAMHRKDALEAQAARAKYRGPAPKVFNGVLCCAECGEPIPAERLAAVPGVGLCRPCQVEASGVFYG